jgi:hypothetical protein
MNPQLKKVCRQRGQETNPSKWQLNGYEADKCPVCNKPLFAWYDTSSHQRCDYCGWNK